MEHNNQLKLKARLQIAMKRTGRTAAPALVLLGILVAVFALACALPAKEEPAPQATIEEGQTRLNFLGDLGMGSNMRTYGRKNGFESLFENVQGIWAASDYTFANLNCVVLVRDESDYTSLARNYLQPTDMAAITAAQQTGINVMALANHHTMDFGAEAMLEERSLLDSLNIAHSGAGQTVQEAAEYVLLPMGARTVAFLSCSYVIEHDAAANQVAGILTSNYAQLYETVHLASQQADLVVVYTSWGKPNAISVSEDQRQAAHQLAAAGADIIIGNYPSVPQPMELYHDSVIFYSLGNLISDQGQTREKDSVMVQLTLEADGSGQLEVIPLRLVEGKPQVSDKKFYANRTLQTLTDELAEGSYELTDGRLYLPFAARSSADT